MRGSLILSVVGVVGVGLLSSALRADEKNGGKDDMKGCPMHSAHTAGVDSRGDSRMGFDHEKTTHHFRLTPNGGTIEVSANSESDDASRAATRSHLAHIARMFSEGDFSAPMFIHDQTPPGVAGMREHKKEIEYRYEETPGGGRIVISTSKADATHAIHEFLRFQIAEHRTGDPLNPELR